jgi:hypothetical protein
MPHHFKKCWRPRHSERSEEPFIYFGAPVIPSAARKLSLFWCSRHSERSEEPFIYFGAPVIPGAARNLFAEFE